MLYSGSHPTTGWATAIRPASSATASTSTRSPETCWTSRRVAADAAQSQLRRIEYADNDRVANYNGITFDLRGRAKRHFFDTSYTRSSSRTSRACTRRRMNPHQFYGPSPWDVPHRFSLTANYEFPVQRRPGIAEAVDERLGRERHQHPAVGYPMTVFTRAPFTAGGDYNADGDNLDYPNVTDYDMEQIARRLPERRVFSPGSSPRRRRGPTATRRRSSSGSLISRRWIWRHTRTHVWPDAQLRVTLRVLQPVQLRQPVSGERPVVLAASGKRSASNCRSGGRSEPRSHSDSHAQRARSYRPISAAVASVCVSRAFSRSCLVFPFSGSAGASTA